MDKSQKKAIRDALQSLINTLPQPIYLIDMEGRVLAANQRFRNEPPQPEKTLCYSYIFGRDTPCGGCELFGSMFQNSLPNRPKGLFVVSESAMTQQVVNIPGLGDIVMEATEHEEKSADSLKKGLITLGALVQTVAHELSNPIIGLHLSYQTLTNILESPNPDLAQARKFTGLIKKDVERAGSIIADIRNYAGRPSDPAKNVHLHSVLSASLNQALRTSSAKGIKTRIRWRAPLALFIPGNRYKLEQCFINIFKNSIEAFQNSPSTIFNPKIYINIGFESAPQKVKKKQGVLIQIIDNAGGILEKDIDHVFEPYFTTKEKWKGMGLGLFVVKTILSEYGATIKLISRQGKTHFIILFPTA